MDGNSDYTPNISRNNCMDYELVSFVKISSISILHYDCAGRNFVKNEFDLKISERGS